MTRCGRTGDVTFAPDFDSCGNVAGSYVDANIRFHKTDRRDTPWPVKRLWACPASLFCPIKWLKALVRSLPPVLPVAAATTPFFRHPSGAPLTGTRMTRFLQERMRATVPDADPEFYNTHSLRIGGAIALMELGASELEVKLMGRWSSEQCAELYSQLTASRCRSLYERQALSEHIEPQDAASKHLQYWF